MTAAARYPLAAWRGASPPGPRWFAKSLATGPERTFIEVEGAKLEILIWGRRGDPGVLLLHGAMAHADWWSHLAPALALRRRVVALSFSGMGGSEWRDTYCIGQQAREAWAAAEAAGLFDAEVAPSVIAHSFGGHSLALMAKDGGRRLSQALIVDSAVGSNRNPEPRRTSAGIYETLPDALARFRLVPDQYAEPYVMDWMGRSGLKEMPAILGGGYAWRFDPDLFVKLAPYDDGGLLGESECPLVFIRGEHSTVTSAAVVAAQRAAAPGAHFVTIPSAAHHLMADAPVALLLELVARLEVAEGLRSSG